MFSIVIPLYNKELSIINTLQSVLNQTFTAWEVIIVNDGSTDNSVEKVATFDDPRIRLIHQENQGVSAARNTGINRSIYEWIVFLDADDLWRENHLWVLSRMISQYVRYKVFCTSFIRSNQFLPVEQEQSILVIEDYFKEVRRLQFFCTIVICIHKSVFKDVGDFNINLNRGEDLELWTRIGRKYAFVRSKVVTAIYRIDGENRSDLNFILEKSRVFNYDFKSCSSQSEFQYYKYEIIKSLIGFIKSKNISLFLKLKRKHSRYISYLDILKQLY